MIESISAITLATHNMPRAVRFYRMLGFEIAYGGEDAAFTSFRAGTSYLNLIAQPVERNWSWWGRVIFYHSDVDALHANVIAAGYAPDAGDAEWGERFFHLTDPDGHELSFAWPLTGCNCRWARAVGHGRKRVRPRTLTLSEIGGRGRAGGRGHRRPAQPRSVIL
jgi:catechol 2,3-dioxygenase-like lactoylglutathione lyase family enzyme